MNADDLGLFLDRARPALLGTVGTVRKDGSPHVVPVWYRWDGERVHIWGNEGRGWVRNLLRDDRVAFSVQEIEPPFAAAVMHGRATVTTGDEPEIDAEIRRITRRYIDEPEVEGYVEAWPELRTVVRIRPDDVRAWSRGY